MLWGWGAEIPEFPGNKTFDKSRNLYGLNYARLSREGYLLICEGYLDVISGVISSPESGLTERARWWLSLIQVLTTIIRISES